jgi:transposase
MLMLIAHRIDLNPNNKQATYFARAAGCARLAYNWALAEALVELNGSGSTRRGKPTRQTQNLTRWHYGAN